MSKAVSAICYFLPVLGLVHHRFDIVDILAHFLPHFLHQTGDAPRVILINSSEARWICERFESSFLGLGSGKSRQDTLQLQAATMPTGDRAGIAWIQYQDR